MKGQMTLVVIIRKMLGLFLRKSKHMPCKSDDTTTIYYYYNNKIGSNHSIMTLT
jgi:hypothetical protein